MAEQILVGVASWADPEFIRDWYPHGMPQYQLLPYYAKHFNMVEVNSTFYAIPGKNIVARWAKQTPSNFTFDIKLPRILSWHSTPPDTLPSGLRKFAKPKGRGVERTHELVSEAVNVMNEVLKPLDQTGKMGIALLQLSPSFSPRNHKVDELGELLDELPWPTAVEFRNAGWAQGEQLKQTFDYLTKHDTAFVNVDGPRSKHFMIMPSICMANLSDYTYVRCHGRNAQGYIHGRTVAERFNYDYPDNELEEIADCVIGLARGTKRVHVVFNNNRSDYAPSAAERLQRILSKRPEGAGRSGRGPFSSDEAQISLRVPHTCPRKTN
jgi:uncharacterized protein YecE (DUF72 family)